MKALILAGGLGMRLRPLTLSVPKPMVPFCNQPLLLHIVRYLQDFGVRDIVFLLYYLPQPIKTFFGDGSALGFRARYVVAAEDFDTAGAVRFAADHVDATCLIVSGDVLTRIDLNDLIAFHYSRPDSLLTMAVKRVSDPGPYGNVDLDKDGRVLRFVEKPPAGKAFGKLVNSGIYVLEPRLLDLIPAGRPASFEREVFPRLVQEGRGLFAKEVRGYWRDLGMVDEYLAAHQDALREAWSESTNTGRANQTGGDAGDLSGSVVGEGSKVGPRATLHRSVIGRQCTIANDVTVNESVIWDNVEIQPGARLTRCIVATDSMIESRATVEEKAIVGVGCRLGRGCRIGSGVRLTPRSCVGPGEEVVSARPEFG